MEDFTTLTHVSAGATSERLSTSLSEWFEEDITFTRWEYVSETGKGDSFMSEVIRIKIHGKNQNGDSKYVPIVIKTIPKNKCRSLTFRNDEFFKNEIQFYTQVLPALLKFQATKNMKEPFDNYPKLFSAFCDGENDYICLEDSSLTNFISYAARQDGIDLYHCKVTLRTFAKYHAISFAMKDQQPEEFDRIRNCISEIYYTERLWPWYERFWARLCGIAIDAVEKEYPNTRYVEKIKEFAGPKGQYAAYKKCIEVACNTLSTGVIGHGDAWTNNFLYKYDNDALSDAKMIDFQLARCASPVTDISFFIYACTTQELRLKHYDHLLKFYHDILSKQIEEMGTDPKKVYPWELFMEEIKKYSFFGLSFSFDSTPFIVLNPEDAVNMDIEGDQKMNVDDFWPIGPIKTKAGRLREANNIVHCVDNGYI